MAATNRQVSATAAATPAVEFVLGVSAIAPGVARARLRRWLDGLGWPADQAEQLVFCVSEAVTNTVEHAYMDAINDPTCSVQLSARHEVVADPRVARSLRWVCIDIHDTGRWHDPDPHRRALGLHLSRRLLDNLVIITRGSPDYGTTVSLRSHPVDQPDQSGQD
jgi:serine/threonine-protein kinase RsbW